MLKRILPLVVVCLMVLCSCGQEVSTDLTLAEDIPEYDGKPYVELNNNVPQLNSDFDISKSFEKYGDLDKYGRCTKGIANLSRDTQPAEGEERGDISEVHPSGWRSGFGWERCHLIGWQLCAENANARNLVTGSHYMNVNGMNPFENEVAKYIETTGNHVHYEVTPIYKGDDLICQGVQMQALSLEDDGAGISFNVFCYNVSPGNEINYKTGAVMTTDEELAAANTYERKYVLNNNSMKFHYPSCDSVKQIAEHNRVTVVKSRGELIEEGYSPCGNCEP